MPSPAPGRCRVCQGPARPGYARCFQCELHAQSAPGLLADAVAPVAYAVKGSPLARDLWLYKAGRPGSGAAGSRLLLLLLAFLHDHGSRVWRQAGMARPSHACVVPSGRGRAGPHPLQALAAPYLALPWVSMRPRPGGDPWARSLDAGRFRAGPEAPGSGGPAARRHLGLRGERPVGRGGAEAGRGQGGGGWWSSAGTSPRRGPGSIG